MAVDPPSDEMVERELQHLDHYLREAKRIAEEEYVSSGPDDMGQYNWLAIACRSGLRQTELLRRQWGQDWLSQQSNELQSAVEDAEAQLLQYRALAMENHATALEIDMPADLPADPFEDTNPPTPPG